MIPMKYPLFTDMALARDVPAHGLMRGDVVRLVEHHVSPDGVEGYSVEVLNAIGDTVVVTTVAAAALDPLRSDEVLAIRHLRAHAA